MQHEGALVASAAGALGANAAGARALTEAVRRSVRSGLSRSVLWLRLAAAGAPRPYNAPMASDLFRDVAARLEGEVFGLGGSNLVLLCRFRADTPDASGPDGAGPDGLPALLNRLFAPPGTRGAQPLFQVWHLPDEGNAILAAIEACPHSPAATAIRAPAASLQTVEAMLDFPQAAELMQRQTGIRLGGAGDAGPFKPAFRELSFSLPALAARVDVTGQAEADPYLFRYLASRLDDRMLSALAAQLSGHGQALAPALPPDSLPLHINLGLGCVLSEPFAYLAAICRARGRTMAVEIALVDACADPARFAAARQVLRQAGLRLVIDDVAAEAVLLVRPGGLGADLIKLGWSERLAALSAGGQRRALADAIVRMGPDRVVLHRADTEAALAWGLANGITLFQGRHMDAMLAAARMRGCADAGACGQAACATRAATLARLPRGACSRLALLDSDAAAMVPA